MSKKNSTTIRLESTFKRNGIVAYQDSPWFAIVADGWLLWSDLFKTKKLAPDYEGKLKN